MPGLTLNDRPVEFRLDPETPLLWALRSCLVTVAQAAIQCGFCTPGIAMEPVEEEEGTR